ncbi:hypothetical protein [Pseudomonas aeruginosa]|uniref:hypothetical protein n=1 Tax=Pseudomonas aeruginosa TaxID=287 RepID=UPI003CC9176C
MLSCTCGREAIIDYAGHLPVVDPATGEVRRRNFSPPWPSNYTYACATQAKPRWTG